MLSKDVRHMTHEASEFPYRVKLGMVARAYSPSTWEGEAGGLVQVQGQLELHKTLSRKFTNFNEKLKC